DRRREQTLDAYVVLAERLDRVVGQPAAKLLEAFLARKHFHPRDPPFSAIRLLDGRVENAHAGSPDIASGAVAFNKRDNRIVRHDELSVSSCDGRTGRGWSDRCEFRHSA